MNILSCFDGMSCGQIALERIGAKVSNYFASEIDKYAIQVTQSNYPDTIQLGSIENYKSWDLPEIDLLIGGSPCQGFSLAGKGLNFDDPRSKLFFTFVDILKAHKPKYFLLENVKMKKEWEQVISNYLGVEPILINSSLVSAQHRERLYWANWDFEQPEDRGIYLKDIIDTGYVDRQKSFCLDANYYKGGNPDRYFRKSSRQLVFDKPVLVGQINSSQDGKIVSVYGKSYTLTAGHNNWPKVSTDKSQTILSTIYKENPKSMLKRKKAGLLVNTYENSYRKLTPLECERLQTVPDNYTATVSNTQRYKMLGNGWTVDVIAHILSYIRDSF